MEYTRIIGEEQGEKYWRASVHYARQFGPHNGRDEFYYKVENFTWGWSQGEHPEMYRDGYDRHHHSSFTFSYISADRENIDDETETVLLEMLRFALKKDSENRLKLISQSVKEHMERIKYNTEALNSAVFRADKIASLEL